MTACAPGYSPYGASGTGSSYNDSNYGGGATKTPVTHSHGGKVHSHALPGTGLRHTHSIGSGFSGSGTGYTGGGGGYTRPYTPPRNPNYNQQQYNPGNNNGGVPHSHCGRVHSHPLPGQGLAHTHGNPACPAGQAAGGNGQQYGGQQGQQGAGQQGTNNGYDYAYGGNGNANGNASGYDYSGQAGNGGTTNGGNNSYYSYGGNNQQGNSNGSNYYDSTQPKAPSNYYDNNSSTSYDYSAPSSNGSNGSGSGSYDSYASGGSGGNSGSGSGSSGSFSPNNYSGGNSYTVKRGDTVFQVMRNTGVYWKDIIRLNNLQAPNYQINPGQSLRLK